MIESPDGEFYTLVRFREKVTKTMYLVECLSPQDGEPNKCGCYFLDLYQMALHPEDERARVKIFDDFAAVRAFNDWIDGPPKGKVVKLVKK